MFAQCVFRGVIPAEKTQIKYRSKGEWPVCKIHTMKSRFTVDNVIVVAVSRIDLYIPNLDHAFETASALFHLTDCIKRVRTPPHGFQDQDFERICRFQTQTDTTTTATAFHCFRTHS